MRYLNIFISLSIFLGLNMAAAERFSPSPKKTIEDMVYVPSTNPFLIDIFETGTSGYDSKPAAMERAEKAVEYCKSVGKRIPTKKEWLAAASGSGKNKQYTLKDDRIFEVGGILLVNVGGNNGSLRVSDWSRLGIDVSGTVGMTGNRGEWVQDSDGTVYQCGGSYRDPAADKLTLDKICATKSDNRWYHEGGATVRCILPLENGAPKITYSRYVNGKLKSYIDTLPKPKVNIQATTYDKLLDRCENKVGVEPLDFSNSPKLKDFKIVGYVVPIQAQGRQEVEYFSCQGVGVSLQFNGQVKNLAAVTPLIIPTQIYDELKGEQAFFENVYGSKSIFVSNYERTYSTDATQLLEKKEKDALSYYLSVQKYQEAAWILEERGYFVSAHKYKLMLKDMMRADISDEDGIGDGVSKKSQLKLKSKVKGVFKPAMGQADADSRIKTEVAVYWIDQILDLRIVPMTIFRQGNNRDYGAFQYWIKDARTGGDRGEKIKFLDTIVLNQDRHQNNYLTVDDGGLGGLFTSRIVAIDHNRTFGSTGYNRSGDFTRIPSRYAWERLKELQDDATMHKYFDDLLNNREFDVLNQRIDEAINIGNEIIRRYGDNAFLEQETVAREPRPNVWDLYEKVPAELRD
ncbi:MAG: hypothetical protein A4S09_00620 [Proteobacteria bacterium SG_bin7]|nr:MAG: hypothetical protein A4S09_00620 [Proteobacteria bacterium SG_bin7]